MGAVEQERLRWEIAARHVGRAANEAIRMPPSGQRQQGPGTGDCSSPMLAHGGVVADNVPSGAQLLDDEEALRLEHLEQQRLLREALLRRERFEQEKIRREINVRAHLNPEAR